jgi:CBS domain-containing protein
LTATARDIMVTPVISVNKDNSLQDVIELLSKHNFSGVPVVDENDVVVGVVSDTDIVRYSHQISVVPFADLSGWISPYADISDLASLRKNIELLAKTKVAQVMTRKLFTATADTEVTEIAKLMSRRRINRVPRADIVRSMAENLDD